MAIEKFAQGAGPGGGLGNKDACKIATPMEYTEVSARGQGLAEAPNGDPMNRFKGDTGDTPFYNFDPLSSQGIGPDLSTPYQPAGAMQQINGNPGPPSAGTGSSDSAKISSPFAPAFGR